MNISTHPIAVKFPTNRLISSVRSAPAAAARKPEPVGLSREELRRLVADMLG